jgi:hypothetical protein
VKELAGLKTYEKVRIHLLKMPPTLYNITVTTVPDGDPDKQQTPGSAKWPGRTDAAVDYEIKIDWTGHDKAPSNQEEAGSHVNDRVVLRVYMAIGMASPSQTQTLNPIGNATLYTTCGPVRVDLLTWAHTWSGSASSTETSTTSETLRTDRQRHIPHSQRQRPPRWS